jgi:hypothetical protein
MNSLIIIIVLAVIATVACQEKTNCSVTAIFFGVFNAGHLISAAD